MDSSEDLLQNVYAYFLKAYRQGAPGGAAQNELVAFENIGFSPGCSTLTGTNVAAAALEEVSHFTDELPQVSGGVYTHTMRTISGTYGSMLDAAEPSSAAALVTFTDFKSRAQKAYEGGAIGSYDGPTPFLPTYPTPIDWYDLSSATNWQSYSYDASVKAPAPTAPPPPAPKVRMQWRVVPQNMRMQILERHDPDFPPATHGPGGHPMFMRTAMMSTQFAGIRAGEPTAQLAPMHAQVAASPAFAAMVAPSAAATAHVSPVQTMNAVRLTGLASVANIATQTQTQPVETPKFTMSFDYCLVRLRRPWLSGDLLATPGWYVPGSRGGDYASGPPANTGPFAAIPTAFIAVKNLVIDANWSDSDLANRANAASFGPFSLLGSATDDKNSVRNPGIQVIAWICTVQPQLPPDTDPALIPVVTPPSGENLPDSSGSGSATQPSGGSSSTGTENPTGGASATGPSSGTGTTAGTSGAGAPPASGTSGQTGNDNPPGDTTATAPTTSTGSATGSPTTPAQPASGSTGPPAGDTTGAGSTDASTAAADPAAGTPGPTS